MARRVPEDPTREDRILFEIVVDAYNESERAMSWYYYLQDQLQMPFAAVCRSVRATSPLKVGDDLEVLAMASEDDCMSEVHVVIKRGRSKLSVPLGQLESLSRNEDTSRGVADWHYWQKRGYEY